MDINLKETYFNEIENKLNEIYFLYENFLTLENIFDFNSINFLLLNLRNSLLIDEYNFIKKNILLKISNIIKILAETLSDLIGKGINIIIYIEFFKDVNYLIEKINSLEFEKLNNTNIDENLNFNLLNWDDEELFFFNLKNEIKQDSLNIVNSRIKKDKKNTIIKDKINFKINYKKTLIII